MDAAQLARHLDVRTCDTTHPAALHVDKWVILRELGTARKRFGITDRQLVVLQALLALRKGAELRLHDLAGLIVHPSNATLSARLNGMPCSTLRRHLAHLVNAGLITRRDSPNGKRYVRRYRDGNRDVFGFDLSPLVRRAPEILQCAAEVRDEEEEIARLRQTISLMRRDLAGVVDMSRQTDAENTLWEEMNRILTDSQRLLRRILNVHELAAVQISLAQALESQKVIEGTLDLGTSEAQIERHYQKSDKEIPVLEATVEVEGTTRNPRHCEPMIKKDTSTRVSNLTLNNVKQACPDILSYSPDGIRDWRDLVDIAQVLSPMMGISNSAWEDAVETMGAIEASTVVAGILQRLRQIKSPGGYLRSLTSKTADGSFSCGPMIASLSRSAS